MIEALDYLMTGEENKDDILRALIGKILEEKEIT